MSTTSGRCTMVFNNLNQILISDGATLRYWNGTALATVGGTAVFTPGIVAYISGYGVVNSSGTGNFFTTTADNFATIAALDFATAESNPDALQTIFVDHNDIFLAGTSTIEIWQVTGGVSFPLTAVPSAKIERGTIAPLSFASEDNTIAFLGDDLIVYRLDAYRPTRISTHAIEEAIRGCSAVGQAAAYAFVYTISGQKFYTLTIPGELTVQYNYATGFWNRATTYGSNSWNVIGSNGHRSDYVLTDAGICELTPDLNQDEGADVVRTARSAPGYAGGRLIAMPEFFADIMVGRGAAGVTAEVMLRVALDAETFRNVLTRSLGPTGGYTRRPVWRGLGQGRRPVLELSASANFNFAIMDTLLNASAANS